MYGKVRARLPVSGRRSQQGEPGGRPAWPVAVAWLAAGVAAYAVSVLVYHYLLVTNPVVLWGHTDEFIYRAAAIEVHQHPSQLYRALFGGPGQAKLAFTYPPIAALVFALFSSFSFAVWQGALVILNLLLLPAIGYASLRIGGRSRLTAAALGFAVAAMALWLEPVYMTLYFGQINLVLLIIGLADLALPDSCRWKGIGVGIVAGMKLTPLIFIPYLLVSRRIRAGLVALGSFAVTVAVGFIVLPAASGDFWFSNLIGKGRFTLQNQSIDGILQRLLPGQPEAHTIWVIAASVVAVAGLTVAALVSRRGYELTGVVVCAVTGLLVSPISWTHHWVWAVVPGLALTVAGDRRRMKSPGDRDQLMNWAVRAASTAVLLFLFVMWPTRQQIGSGFVVLPRGLLRLTPYGNGVEKTWHGWQLVTGNYYVIAGAVAVAAVGAYLALGSWRAHRSEH
jgi:alpha-1,2-mannosyltransferase